MTREKKPASGKDAGSKEKCAVEGASKWGELRPAHHEAQERTPVRKRARQRKPKPFDMLVRRRREIESMGKDRGVGDTDDLHPHLVAWTIHRPGSTNLVGDVIRAAQAMGREDLTEAEAAAVIDEANATGSMSADKLAAYLSLKYDERQRLRITTIGAVDLNRAERARRRDEKKRLAKERKRRERGAKPRDEYEAASLSRTKPWVAEGISRAQWYRRRSAAKTDETSAAPAVLTIGVAPPVSLAVSAQAGGRRSRRHDEMELEGNVSARRSLPKTTAARKRRVFAAGPVMSAGSIMRPEINHYIERAKEQRREGELAERLADFGISKSKVDLLIAHYGFDEASAIADRATKAASPLALVLDALAAGMAAYISKQGPSPWAARNNRTRMSG
jgi:hypothetical protein